jgi:8-oxo-dGTP diphosphatase
VEAGETLAQAVAREVAEETTLQVSCGPLVGWVERIGPGYHFVILDFAVTLASPGTPQAGDDAAQAAWVPFGEIGGLTLVEGLADFLAEQRVLGPG